MSTMRSNALWLAAILFLMTAPAWAADAPGDLFGRLKANVKEDQPFQLLVRIHLPAGAIDKFAVEAAKAAKASEAEPGCEMYAFFKDLEKPDTIILLEKWKSVAALKTHLAQPYTVSLLKALGDLKVEPEIHLLNPLSASKPAP
jgi:quinol monooxygenase YgiN